jgi:hypothetical protein
MCRGPTVLAGSMSPPSNRHAVSDSLLYGVVGSELGRSSRITQPLVTEQGRESIKLRLWHLVWRELRPRECACFNLLLVLRKGLVYDNSDLSKLFAKLRSHLQSGPCLLVRLGYQKPSLQRGNALLHD